MLLVSGFNYTEKAFRVNTESASYRFVDLDPNSPTDQKLYFLSYDVQQFQSFGGYQIRAKRVSGGLEFTNLTTGFQKTVPASDWFKASNDFLIALSGRSTSCQSYEYVLNPENFEIVKWQSVCSEDIMTVGTDLYFLERSMRLYRRDKIENMIWPGSGLSGLPPGFYLRKAVQITDDILFISDTLGSYKNDRASAFLSMSEGKVFAVNSEATSGRAREYVDGYVWTIEGSLTAPYAKIDFSIPSFGPGSSNSFPLSEANHLTVKGRASSIDVIAFKIVALSFFHTALFSVQDEYRSVIVSVLINSPAKLVPQWATVSASI